MQLVVDGVRYPISREKYESLVPEVTAALQGAIEVVEVNLADEGGVAVLLLTPNSSVRFEGSKSEAADMVSYLTKGP